MLDPHLLNMGTKVKLVEYTKKCIKCARMTEMSNEVIIIDNGSPEAQMYGADVYVRFPYNTGIPHAWNAGIKLSQGEYICHLNNDCFVPEKWAESLIALKKHYQATFISPRYGVAKYLTDFNTEVSDGCGGACFITEYETYDRLGLFDESFGLYFHEDTDMYERVKRAGERWLYADKIQAEHIGRASCKEHGDWQNMLKQTQSRFKQKWAVA